MFFRDLQVLPSCLLTCVSPFMFHEKFFASILWYLNTSPWPMLLTMNSRRSSQVQDESIWMRMDDLHVAQSSSFLFLKQNRNCKKNFAFFKKNQLERKRYSYPKKHVRNRKHKESELYFQAFLNQPFPSVHIKGSPMPLHIPPIGRSCIPCLTIKKIPKHHAPASSSRTLSQQLYLARESIYFRL